MEYSNPAGELSGRISRVGALGETQYTRRGDGFVAWRRTAGSDRHVLLFQAAYWPMAQLEDGPWGYWTSRLASLGGLVVFDRRGVGESDPIDVGRPPTPRDWSLDAVAILDDAGIEKATVIGIHDGGLGAIHCAAEFPARVDRLVLIHAFASFAGDDALPRAGIDGYRERFSQIEAEGPSSEVDLWELLAPSAADDVALRSWFNRLGRLGASPATAAALQRVVDSWDVRELLTSVAAPTTVLHRIDNQFVPVEHARYLAARIDGATCIEVPGVDHVPWIGDVDSLLDPLEEAVTGTRAARRGERRLRAVLFTDLVGSTARGAAVGDRHWRNVVERHDDIAREIVEAHDGWLVKSTGDGVLAVFELATTAIRCAAVLRDRLAVNGLTIRSGVHAGEIEVFADDVTGTNVNVAARIMSAAPDGAICTSQSVSVLVAGSGIAFEELVDVTLKGIPGNWRLLRAEV